jgi:hypothetical protein
MGGLAPRERSKLIKPRDARRRRIETERGVTSNILGAASTGERDPIRLYVAR